MCCGASMRRISTVGSLLRGRPSISAGRPTLCWRHEVYDLVPVGDILNTMKSILQRASSHNMRIKVVMTGQHEVFAVLELAI